MFKIEDSVNAYKILFAWTAQNFETEVKDGSV